MKVYSQLISAQLENKSSDYTATVIGRVWWNTATGKTMVADGTNVRALLRNDANCVIGNNGTANNNIRLHRGANGVLQFVQGGDSTGEGSLSTSLAQISARAENYTTAGLPSAAAGNAGRIVFDTTASVLKYDAGGSYTTVASGTTTNRVNAMYDFYVGSAAQVTSGAATHSSIASAITAASAGNSIYLLEGTYTENITVSKTLFITGSGFGSIIDGTVTFNSSSGDSHLRLCKITGTITLQAGADGVHVRDVWVNGTSAFAIDSTVVGEIVEGTPY